MKNRILCPNAPAYKGMTIIRTGDFTKEKVLSGASKIQTQI